MAGALDEAQRAALVEKGVAKQELTPFSQEDKTEFMSAFSERAGKAGVEPPKPSSWIDFANTDFERAYICAGYIFAGAASFHSATFSPFVDFHSATFSQHANFRSATFSQTADFQSATFSARAIFLNAKFAAWTGFSGAKFETSVPDFRGAEMHEATEWDDVSWPKFRAANRSYGQNISSRPEDKTAARDWVFAYERLKQEMEKLKKHEDEQFFFRQELRARRAADAFDNRFSWNCILNYLYELASDYGYSVTRPLGWLVGVIFLGALALSCDGVVSASASPFENALRLNIANVFSFVPLVKDIVSDVTFAKLSLPFQIASIAEAIIAVILFFLLGLALRNRFRMK